MMVDTTIYGYVTGGGAYHVDCAGDPADAHDDNWGRLYYLDDEDPHGLACDECSEYIFEPVGVHAFDPGDNGQCRECYSDSWCGEFEACELHLQPDTAEVGLPLAGFTNDEQVKLWSLLDRFESVPGEDR